MLLIGKVYAKAKHIDIGGAIACIRYYAGWADKISGKTIEVFPFSYDYQPCQSHTVHRLPTRNLPIHAMNHSGLL